MQRGGRDMGTVEQMRPQPRASGPGEEVPRVRAGRGQPPPGEPVYRRMREAWSVLIRQNIQQPGTCGLPVALDGGRRDVQGLGGFLDGQPAEIAKFDDA